MTLAGALSYIVNSMAAREPNIFDRRPPAANLGLDVKQ